MIKSTKLILVRHAPVEKVTGYIPQNNPNAVVNLDHIKKLSSYIPNKSFCYTSPLKRTIQTANALSKFVKFKDILVEKDLVEQNFGDWAGKKISDVWEELKNNNSQHNFSFICPEISIKLTNSFSLCKISFFPESFKKFGINTISISTGVLVECGPIFFQSDNM